MKIFSIAPAGYGVGATSNILALSLVHALTTFQRNLIIPLAEETIPIENMIGPETWKIKNADLGFDDAGTDALLRKLRSGHEHTLNMENSVLSVAADTWNFLPAGSGQQNNNVQKEILEIVEYANEQYDMVWIDGTHIELKQQLYYMDYCDCILVHLPHNMFYIKNYFSFSKTVLNLHTIHPFLLLSRYQNDSKYNSTNIRRNFQLHKNQMGVLPYSVEYADAVSDGMVYSFFKKSISNKRKQFDSYFMEEIKSNLEKIKDYGGN